jgi:hypothetical protein
MYKLPDHIIGYTILIVSYKYKSPLKQKKREPTATSFFFKLTDLIIYHKELIG